MARTELTLETIMRDTIWVAKMTYGRFTGTYDELEYYRNSEECRDFDISCKQPKHLQDFFSDYTEYECEHGFTYIQDFYKIWSEEQRAQALFSFVKFYYICYNKKFMNL